MSMTKLLNKIKDEYLPRNIQGGKATWVVKSGDKPIAVIAQEWDEPRILHDGQIEESECLLLHVEYLAQNDPEAIYKEYKGCV